FYVPDAAGGSLRSFEVLTSLVRSVASRDLTVAIAHAKTFLGVAPVWIAGNSAQQERSEEHTSELQSQSNIVCRLLLEKKISAILLAHADRVPRTLFLTSPIRCRARARPDERQLPKAG